MVGGLLCFVIECWGDFVVIEWWGMLLNLGLLWSVGSGAITLLLFFCLCYLFVATCFVCLVLLVSFYCFVHFVLFASCYCFVGLVLLGLCYYSVGCTLLALYYFAN